MPRQTPPPADPWSFADYERERERNGRIALHRLFTVWMNRHIETHRNFVLPAHDYFNLIRDMSVEFLWCGEHLGIPEMGTVIGDFFPIAVRSNDISFYYSQIRLDFIRNDCHDPSFAFHAHLSVYEQYVIYAFSTERDAVMFRMMTTMV